MDSRPPRRAGRAAEISLLPGQRPERQAHPAGRVTCSTPEIWLSLFISDLQLFAVLDADLQPEDGKLVLCAPGVDPQDKGIGVESAAEMSSSRLSRSLHTTSNVVG